jgi:hypothetical protein
MHDRSDSEQAAKFCPCVSIHANLGFYSVSQN